MARVRSDQGRWPELPSPPPAHGTFLAWYQGCRCDLCEQSGQGFLRDLARRYASRRPPAPPPSARLSADDQAHLEPAVRDRGCPFCGALRYHRCRDPHFPLHFTETHPERHASWAAGGSGDRLPG